MRQIKIIDLQYSKDKVGLALKQRSYRVKYEIMTFNLAQVEIAVKTCPIIFLQER